MSAQKQRNSRLTSEDMKTALGFVEQHFDGNIEKATNFLDTIERVGGLEKLKAALVAYQDCQAMLHKRPGEDVL